MGHDLKFFPDPVLSTKCEPVPDLSEACLAQIRGMEESLYSLPGLAVAAPQLGVARRIILLNMRKIHEKPETLILINPFVKSSEGAIHGSEGCLSIPGIFEEIPRAQRVEVTGMDLRGREVSMEAGDLLARVIQHEIDHLDGRLFWDRLPEKERKKLQGKYFQYWAAERNSLATPLPR